MSMQADARLWIHGGYTDAAGGEGADNINPGTGAVIGRRQHAGAEDVDRAVASAGEGQRRWAAMTGAERGRVLQRAAELLRTHRDELARLESLDGGKPIAETPEADVDSGADCLEYFAGQAASLQGEYQAVDGGFYYTRPEPLGVCAGIGAWNYPLQIACWKTAPALAAGNTMIFKPAELTPLSALRLAELFREAGLPDGVFNVVQGEAETGQALMAHPRGGQGLAHRRGGHRQGGHARRRQDAQGSDHGARRQVAADRIRRRRNRQRRLRRPARQLLHPGRDLHQRHPGVRPRVRARRLHRTAGGTHREAAHRRPNGPGNRRGRADQPRAISSTCSDTSSAAVPRAPSCSPAVSG
ncbi:MAG: aldehyde dehydrogenase family protein [Arhodomonas sp.]|nr:aldehyde dehydrogenase family protein [Arhodomonas sp.]